MSWVLRHRSTNRLYSADMEREKDPCILCYKSEDEHLKKAKLGPKGCDGIRKANIERGDSVITVSPGDYVHIECRKKYCNPFNIKCDKESTVTHHKSTPKTLRSSKSEKFIFSDTCLFCGKPAKVNKRKRGHDVFPVRTLDFQKNLEVICNKRGDEWAETITSRLETIHDLPAADAVYHQNCSVNFRTLKSVPTEHNGCSSEKKKKGRPISTDTHNAFLRVIKYLEDNDNEQITISDLVSKMVEECGETAFSFGFMKRKIQEHFSESVIITSLSGKDNVVTLRHTASSILHTFYKHQDIEGSEAKKISIIETAASLIRSDIKSMKVNKDEYPLSADIELPEKNQEYLPESLKIFLKAVICEKKCIQKIASIGQAVIQATRPRMIIAPLQLSLGIQMHHQFASKFLIDTLNSLGFCSSYTEIQKFEACAAVSQRTDIPGFVPGSFVQYVADNVDHNSRTIDGKGTFHGMGIIACVTPGTWSTCSVKRRTVSKEEICGAGKIEMSYYKSAQNSKKQLRYENMKYMKATDKTAKLDILIKLTEPIRSSRPAYSGLMQMVQKGEHPGKSSVIFMPMIDLDPGDLSCIYTTLNFVKDHATKYETTPILTFDQPLYWKAINIIHNEPQESCLHKILLRLGGFHTIMSFLGSIGHIMQGSGLNEVLETVYAPNAVLHMMTGKAVARAIRGHFLVEKALMSILISNCFEINVDKNNNETTDIENDKVNVSENDSEIDTLGILYDNVIEGRLGVDDIDKSETLNNSANRLEKMKTSLKRYRTAALWLQYLRMIGILQSFIKAERIGDWLLHLDSLYQMLPFFAAAGHNLYLKSAYVYLQNMTNLENTNPDVFRYFKQGLHVVRRSDRYWGGLSTDLIIEQVLMRAVKSNGGLTRGKGLGESQRAQWLLSLPSCADYNRSMQDFCQIKYHSSEQHKECGPARIQRDVKDSQIVLTFLQERSPFTEDLKLRNIETGVESELAANVDTAEEVGMKVINTMKGKCISEHSFKRANQATALTTKPMVKLPEDEQIQVDPQLLFQRLITAALRQSDNISEYFSYELSSVPSTLFDSCGFPKVPQKAILAEAIWSIGDCHGEDEGENVQYVLDGGSLIHRLPWSQGHTFGDICHAYTEYVNKQYRTSSINGPVIVFDGYMAGPSIKDVAHIRRSHGVTSTNVNFKETTPFRGKKDKFLSNVHNKQRFINMLSDYISNSGCTVSHAEGDADVLIVKTTIEHAKKTTTILIGEDTDLLILLCHFASAHSFTILLKPGSRYQFGKNIKVWNIQKTRKVLGENMCKVLPVVHALTGCDSTSKIHGIGKGTVLKKFMSDSKLIEIAQVFIKKSEKMEILKAGESILVALFGGHSSDCLDILRLHKFSRKVTIGLTYVQVHSIPPTSAAAAYHSYRVYFQVQNWIDEKFNLSPTDWGWFLKDDKLFPVKTDLPPAPDNLLKIIRCNCKVNCDSKRCTCRKHGLDCSTGCGECKGIQCSNTSSVLEIDLADDV